MLTCLDTITSLNQLEEDVPDPIKVNSYYALAATDIFLRFTNQKNIRGQNREWICEDHVQPD